MNVARGLVLGVFLAHWHVVASVLRLVARLYGDLSVFSMLVHVHSSVNGGQELLCILDVVIILCWYVYSIAMWLLGCSGWLL